MLYNTPLRLDTIAAYHRLMRLPAPEHPLISVIRFEDIRRQSGPQPPGIVNDFYCIALKRTFNARMRYGQQDVDFDAGVLLFLAPGQVIAFRDTPENDDFRHTDWLLMIHPDFLWNTSLTTRIGQYDYFDYSVHEALHLSEKEEHLVIGTMGQIAHEYRSNLDRYSKAVIIAQLELLLTYAERFYQQQFLTREKVHYDLLICLETLLTDYLRSEALTHRGLPTVSYVAEALHLSPSYLSCLLTGLTGQSTQQYIHDKLIALAKEKLTTTSLTVSEIAFDLGFEHPQSFSKLFKSNTAVSPLAFRQSFN